MILPITVGDPSSIIAERRTPYDRGRDHPALGNVAFRSPSSRDVLSTSSALCGRLRVQATDFLCRRRRPAAGRRAVPRPAVARRRAGAAGTRCARRRCSRTVLPATARCCARVRTGSPSGTSFIAICVTTLTRAFGQVEHQAVVAPGIRMGDIAQADDGVAGADTASPVPEQVPDHLLDAPERPTPAQQYRGVRQMQVRPKPGPFRCAGDDRDVGVGRQVPPAARRGRSPGRDPWSILACSEPRSRPGCRSTLNEISERGGLHDRWRFRTYDRLRCPAATTNTAISPRGASRPPSSRNCSPPAATSSPSSPGPSSKPTRCCAWTSRRSASTVPACRSSDSSARVEAYSSSPRSMASNDSSRLQTPAAANMVRSRWAPNCSRSPSSTPPNCRHRCTERR